jgi:hypothetical protein
MEKVMDKNESLNKALAEGETILWNGVAQPYSLFDESRRSGTIRSLCWALGWAIFSIGGYYYLAASNGTPISTGVILFLIGISLLIVWMPISDKSKIKKLTYAVTNKRVMVAPKDSDAPLAMPIADIDAVRVEKADNGNCHVKVGSSVFKMAAKKLPVAAYRGEFIDQDGKKDYKGLVLFNVRAEDGKVISNLLKKPDVC